MKGDLISRQAVLAALSSRLSIVDMVGVAEIVESVPAVEAEPVVHAHWVDRYNYKYANRLYVCSRCGKKAPFEIERDELGHERVVQSFTDRCPECGAHMDERYPNV